MKNKKLVLFDIDYTLFDTSAFKDSSLTNYSLYEEIIATLRSLSKIATLGIFSEGEIDFQEDKLARTGISKLFLDQHIHIVEDKTKTIERVIDKYKDYELFVIDDRISNLEMAKAHNPKVRAVWVKRGPFAVKDTDFVPDLAVSNLADLVNFVKNED